LRVGNDIYESIGVRPLINCRGTLTVIGGSLELPEVRAAKEAAAGHYAQLDELMEAISKRLAALTKAEWGIVTSGCAAAMAHATAACVAGANPDLHVRIPDLTGFEKDEVIIPRESRNVYDSAIRSVGVRIIQPETAEEFEAAIGPRTAMAYIFANSRMEEGPLTTDDVIRISNDHNVPVLVDAAAEILTTPSTYLERGATMVAYSGGKCIRGPQCAGLLLGRKDLVQSAWINSAPHHGYGRAMKVGKEEMIGMLMAVEMWVKRDHPGEWRKWLGWLDHIADRVASIDGVETSVRRKPGEGLSNRSPSLRIQWDSEELGITGAEVSELLYNGEPRIALRGGRRRRSGAGSATQTGVSITAYMMGEQDYKVVADRVFEVLAAKRPPKPSPSRLAPAADLSGIWDVEIEYISGKTVHTLSLDQKEGRITGIHEGDFVSRNLRGTVEGDKVTLNSWYLEVHGDQLLYNFSGQIAADKMSGELDLGEYLKAKWTASRHSARRG
jgi:L-seryl-tRNA(Ser) seleniumtransferase